jgi:hypothetical protein
MSGTPGGRVPFESSMNLRFKYGEQELGHKIWTIVQLFYRSLLVFRDQFESYERKLEEFALRANTTRDDLRLNPADLATLLDFKKLERLRDDYIFELKELCHNVFRGQDRTDLLDRYVSDIFHEISILKEEHYNVKTYAPLYERDSREIELRGIVDAARSAFAKLTSHVLYLFHEAQIRMEDLLGSFRNLPICIRSLYIHRGDFVAECYPDGLKHFYRLMYPLGPTEGYYTVGLSFYHAGFFAEAGDAFREAWAAFRDDLAAGRFPPGSEARLALEAILAPLSSKLRRLAPRAGYPAVLPGTPVSDPA